MWSTVFVWGRWVEVTALSVGEGPLHSLRCAALTAPFTDAFLGKVEAKALAGCSLAVYFSVKNSLKGSLCSLSLTEWSRTPRTWWALHTSSKGLSPARRGLVRAARHRQAGKARPGRRGSHMSCHVTCSDVGTTAVQGVFAVVDFAMGLKTVHVHR